MPLIRSVHVHVLRLMSVFFLLTLFSPLTASAANLTGLSLAPPNPTLNINDTLQLIATGIYDDGAQQVIAQAREVSAGGVDTCAVATDGTVRCWGSTPIQDTGITNAVAISQTKGEYSPHVCALLANGTVRCWGDNQYGQLGNGSTVYSATPVSVFGISTAVAVSAGGNHACAVLADGTVRCWGHGYSGQLGYGTAQSFSAPVPVRDINTAVAVSVGSNHSCAVLADGTARCWGYNGWGQLGNGSTVNESAVPVTVSGLSSAVAISAGSNHSCALLVNGGVRCWGDNDNGQLGNGTITYPGISIPVAVSGLSTAVAISAGGEHNCAVLSNSKIQCWGSNHFGQFGNGTDANYSSIPVFVSGLDTAVRVGAGARHSCAALADGAVRCWGGNIHGQLGNGTTTQSLLPVTVSNVNTAVAVSAAAYGIVYNHVCALSADRSILCWGNNLLGQLGNGTKVSSSTPVTVSGISNALSVSAGPSHTCAVLINGSVRCWGVNFYGQLGNGAAIYSDPSLTPVAVVGINSAVTVASGENHTCALLADGTVRCWGVLGVGESDTVSTPVTVSGLNSVVSISAGRYHTCAVLADRTVRCWGHNGSGQLGNGTIDYTIIPVPVIVNGLSNVTAVSAGTYHSCALLTNGAVRCWGANFSGQLGNGTSTDSLTPVTVSGISTAVAISAGFSHSCAVLVDGTARCWGANRVGQLGNGSTTVSLTPVVVSGINNAVAVSAAGYGSGTQAYDYSCVLLANRTIQCWGDNTVGQLGNGVAGYFLLPTPTLGYYPLTWSSSNTSVATVDTVGNVHAISAGTARITASYSGFSVTTTITVTNTAPSITGFWPGAGPPGVIVFVFGSHFVPFQTRVQVNAINADLVQVLAPDLLLFVLPEGNTAGPITVTTSEGSASSSSEFGVLPTGLTITGLWPGSSRVGGIVFVFGSGFVVNQTQVSVNGVPAALRQVLDPNLLIFMVPPGASTGVITVTTPNGSVGSGGVLTVAP